MRRHLLSAALLILVFAAGVLVPAAVDADSSPKRYIVMLKSGTDAPATADDHAKRRGADVEHVYRAIKGYVAKIPTSRIDSIKSDSRVASVEPDGVAHVSAQSLPWGVNRVDADISSTKAGNGSGSISNVNAYIIDTGIRAHTDLNLVKHVNFAGGVNYDCSGHGSHVAGTLAARDNTSDVVGVAPGAPLTGVKVLGCNGSGSWSNIIRGIDWVTANAKKPAVANMSLTGSVSQSLDDAVRRSAASGVFYTLAAGNSSTNACNVSPARAGAGTNNGIMTVAATDSSEREASWSNYGSCVDIWAPGVSILSTKRVSGTETRSGTSMASPHVGGGGALYLNTHATSTPAAVETALRTAAKLTGTVSKNGAAIRREYVGGF
jgi:aqualysin 1